MFRLKFEIFGRGWIKVKISSDNNEYDVTGSYLSDCVFDTITASTALLLGANEIIFKWQEEPGEHRWLLLKENDELIIKILFFNNEFNNKENESGKLVFETRVSLIEYFRSLIRGIDRLIYNIGTDEYYKLWNYEFPIDKLDKLRDKYEIYKESINDKNPK